MRLLYRLGGMAFLAFCGIALGEPSTRVAWTPETLKLVRMGDVDRGKATAQTCEACHANNPTNAGTPFPYLDGQLATYTFRQLRDYKDGSRSNEIMAGIVAGLTEKDMADVAAWYSQQPPPAPQPGDQDLDSARRIVQQGDSKRMIPACSVCHGANGRGEPVDTPALGGQKAAYLEQTLLAYRSGARHNDIYRRMRLIVQPLSEEEIKQLAAYYAGLGP